MVTAVELDADSAAQYVNDIGAALFGVYAGVELAVQAELARRLYEAIENVPDLLTRLQVARELEAFTADILNTLPTDVLAATIVERAAELGRQAADAQVGDWTPPRQVFTPPQSWDAIAAMRTELANRFDTVHANILRAVPDIYRDLTSQFLAPLLLGREVWQATQRQLTQGILAEGLTGYTDVRGRKWRPGTYAEMATRTAAIRAFSDAGVDRLHASGLDFVTPVGRADACDRCRPWHGKVLTRYGTTGPQLVQHAYEDRLVLIVVDATVDQARSAGLQHPNCRDVFVGVFPGLDMPVTVPPGFSLAGDPALIAKEAQLRRLEVRVREAKRLQALAYDEANAAEYTRIVREAQAAIRRHVATTGVTRRRYREQLAFSDGRAPNAG